MQPINHAYPAPGLSKLSQFKNAGILFLFVISSPAGTSHLNTPKAGFAEEVVIKLADPTIFFHAGTYYLYGTGGDVNRGFQVYSSQDMKTWKGPGGYTGGYALVKGDSYGSKGFWAPQVFSYKNKFYMAYTANENIAVAESESPLGPFKQKEIKPIGNDKQIDPYVFFDDNGKKYLYHVRLSEGNRMFVAELNDELSNVEPNTTRECFAAADQPWENTSNAPWPVCEGPSLLKHNGLYYLFYSANDFRNINYAVGYAVARGPYGPWKKYGKNPVISRQVTGINGPGHGDFIKTSKGNFTYVFHTHSSDSTVSPRLTAVINGKFTVDVPGADRFDIDEKSFRYLQIQGKVLN